MTPKAYMERPYTYCLTYDSESRTWTGKIKELPGCIAQGDTIWTAFNHLYWSALGWIAAALELGQEIPEPEESQ